MSAPGGRDGAVALDERRDALRALVADPTVRALTERPPLSVEGHRKRAALRVRSGLTICAMAVPTFIAEGPVLTLVMSTFGLAVCAAGIADRVRAGLTPNVEIVLVTAARDRPWAPFGARWDALLEDASGAERRMSVPDRLRGDVQPGAIGVADVHAGWLRDFEPIVAASGHANRGQPARAWMTAGRAGAQALCGAVLTAFLAWAISVELRSRGSHLRWNIAELAGLALEGAFAAAAAWVTLVGLRDACHVLGEPPAPRDAAGPEGRRQRVEALLDRTRPELRNAAAWTDGPGAAGAADLPSFASPPGPDGLRHVPVMVVGSPRTVQVTGNTTRLEVLLDDACGDRATFPVPRDLAAPLRAGVLGVARIRDGDLESFRPRGEPGAAPAG